MNVNKALCIGHLKDIEKEINSKEQNLYKDILMNGVLNTDFSKYPVETQEKIEQEFLKLKEEI